MFDQKKWPIKKKSVAWGHCGSNWSPHGVIKELGSAVFFTLSDGDCFSLQFFSCYQFVFQQSFYVWNRNLICMAGVDT